MKNMPIPSMPHVCNLFACLFFEPIHPANCPVRYKVGFLYLNPAIESIEKQLPLWCNEPSVWLDGAVFLICLLRSSEGEGCQI